MRTQKPSVLVGMSGGVDSSVAASLLVKRGFRVVGGFIKNWSDAKDLMTGECSWRGDRRDAMRVAAQLGIPLLTFDFEAQYRSKIVENLFQGYAEGETPNPDILCNEIIKFGLFVEEANRLGINFVATGHYARLAYSPWPMRFFQRDVRLLRGKDSDKDQSYFLYRVPQAVLKRTIFPIGDLRKSRVRQIARHVGLPTAEKPDSQGICFIGKLDMAEFLRKKIPPAMGDIVDEQGNILGRHQGMDIFTIGQRHGILVSRGEDPWYVADKDFVKNRLIVVQGMNHPRLFSSSTVIHDLCWTHGRAPRFPFHCEIQVRYRQDPVRATISKDTHDACIAIRFATPVKAVAPGQSAVIYRGNECFGGGMLKPSISATLRA